MFELFDHFCTVLNGIKSDHGFVPLWLNLYFIYFAVNSKANGQHIVCKAQAFLPIDIKRRNELIVLLDSDAIEDLFPDVLSLVCLLHFLLEKLFSFL